MRRFLFLATFFVALAWAGPVSADQIGDTQTFFVDSSYDAEGAETVSATLRAIGTRVYLYVDNRHWSLLSQAQRTDYQSRLHELASQFDTVIHPRSTTFWGSEPTPGVDDDPRLTVLLERVVSGNGGYFRTIDNYPQSRAPEGNGREMIFLAAVDGPTTIGRSFLAHEFQHLISFNQKELIQDVSDDLWLNEARSEYNVTVVGYSQPYAGGPLQRRVFSFLRTPSDSLIEWPNIVADYAIATIFTHYLADRYGAALLQSTIRSPLRGVRALEAWLASTGRPERFGEVFADWMAAVSINDDADVRYGYRTSGLDTIHVEPEDELRVSASTRDSADLRLKEWQPSWTSIEVAGTSNLPPALNLEISGPDVSNDSYFLGGTAIADYSGVSQVIPWRITEDSGAISIPTSAAGRTLRSVTFTLAHGNPYVTEDDEFPVESVSVDVWLGDAVGTSAVPTSAPSSTELKDGDLIRRPGQAEVYVIWGKYRRYLVPGILELYGFQNRPVTVVADDVFSRYTTSNYIRQVDTEPVYAVWPDGTKHWFNITAAQWDATGRDWNAIFIVNEREAAFYATGADITR